MENTAVVLDNSNLKAFLFKMKNQNYFMSFFLNFNIFYRIL